VRDLFGKGGDMSIDTSRRRLVLAALCAAGGAGSAAGLAAASIRQGAGSDYPTRPVRLIVPLPPGGGADIVARLICSQLSQRLGQQVLVENKGGGGGVIAAELVAHADADGYTLLLGTATTHAIDVSLIKKLGYDPVKDFAPISLVASLPLILVLNPSVPVDSLQELIVYARARPGKLNFGSTSNGSSIHLAGEMLNMVAGIEVVHIPYKGAAPALTDLLGGRFTFMFTTIPPVLQYVRSGQLKALAVASAARTPLMPELPTTAEAGAPGVEASSWNGILAPAGTPREVVKRLNKEVVAIMQAPEMRQRLLALGVEAKDDTPEEFAAFMKQDTDRYAKVVKVSGAKID
jgi:tripartite-type tricarboxylate transporter receptor subunit TctC